MSALRKLGVSKLIVDVDKGLHRECKQYALDHDTTLREIVTEAIRDKLNKEAPANENT